MLGLNTGFTFSFSSNFTFRDPTKIQEENSSSDLQLVFFFSLFYFLKKRLFCYSRNLLAAATSQIIQSNHYQINLTYFVTQTFDFNVFLRKEI